MVGRESALLEDKVSAVLHKLSSQDQQFVSGRAGDQLLDLKQEPVLASSRSISKDSSCAHLRADEVKAGTQDHPSVQNVPTVTQRLLSCAQQIVSIYTLLSPGPTFSAVCVSLSHSHTHIKITMKALMF